MARIRVKPGFDPFYRLLTDGNTRMMTTEWQEIDDALITAGMRKRHDLEITASEPVTDSPTHKWISSLSEMEGGLDEEKDAEALAEEATPEIASTGAPWEQQGINAERPEPGNITLRKKPRGKSKRR